MSHSWVRSTNRVEIDSYVPTQAANQPGLAVGQSVKWKVGKVLRQEAKKDIQASMIDIEQEDSYTHKRPEIVYWEELMENYHIPYDQLETAHYIATKLWHLWSWVDIDENCSMTVNDIKAQTVEMDDPSYRSNHIYPSIGTVKSSQEVILADSSDSNRYSWYVHPDGSCEIYISKKDYSWKQEGIDVFRIEATDIRNPDSLRISIWNESYWARHVFALRNIVQWLTTTDERILGELTSGALRFLPEWELASYENGIMTEQVRKLRNDVCNGLSKDLFNWYKNNHDITEEDIKGIVYPIVKNYNMKLQSIDGSSAYKEEYANPYEWPLELAVSWDFKWLLQWIRNELDYRSRTT